MPGTPCPYAHGFCALSRGDFGVGLGQMKPVGVLLCLPVFLPSPLLL